MNPLDLFKSVKSGIITVVVAAIVLTVSGTITTLWFQRNNARTEAAELAVKVSGLEQDVFKEQVRASGYKVIIEQLEETYSKIEKNRAFESEIDKDIKDAPIEDDAAIAPVLRRTFDSVDRLLRDNR